jgi:large conductance mechanosensitive channel
MKNMVAEFKAFIMKGDIVMIAVAFVMALYFKGIIDQIVAGVIDPIIAAIVGESSLETFGFNIGDARISIGLVFEAIIDFVIVSLVLFLIVKFYNHLKREEDEAAGPSEVELLTEIRDELRARNSA